MCSSILYESNPILSREWNYTKNGCLTPNDVSSGSGKKVWWKCERGHEWQSSICNRVKGRSCPYCVNKKVLQGYNDLATTHPEIAKEWHPTKNGYLVPKDFTFGSGKKTWWKCKKGHEWQSSICNRVKGRNCPYCLNKKVLQGYNDLATTHPEIAKQWHPTKNEYLTPKDLTFGSEKKIWWQCEQGHEWQSVVYSRTKKDSISTCPHCKAELGTAFGTSFPQILLFYYIKKYINEVKHNYTFSFDDFKFKNDILIERGDMKLAIEYDGYYFHKDNLEKDLKINAFFKDKVKIHLLRIRECINVNKSLQDISDVGVDCIMSYYKTNSYSDLACLVNDVIKYISNYFNLNKENIVDITGADVSANEIDIYNLVSFYKVGNSLETLNPDIASEWHPTKNGNIKPRFMSIHSNKRVWWKCKEGHEWKASVNSRSNGTNCPYCSNQKVLMGYNDLGSKYPYLVSEWNYDKNGGITPYDIVYGSNKKVWWKCKKGHEWQAIVNHRSKRGVECPYCTNNKLLVGYNDFQTVNPKLSLEWHPLKNNKLTPSDFINGSNEKVWWKCKNGHEWSTTIASRISGTDCPFCTNRKVLKGFNDLATTHPHLLKEWHRIKNKHISPEKCIAGSHKRVWWKCVNGHEWFTRINNRTSSNKTGCPYCFGNKLLSGYNDLHTVNPTLATEWHPTKNGSLNPNEVTSNSHKKVWWQCERGHEWQAKISNRNNGNNCPVCTNQTIIEGVNDLQYRNPELASEWHPSLNGKLKPTNIALYSKKVVWWKCKKGHEWNCSVSNRKNGKNGCPICSGRRLVIGVNDLATLHPNIASLWDYNNNKDIRPSDFTPVSGEKVHWKCSCGNQWIDIIRYVVKKNGCSVCKNKK